MAGYTRQSSMSDGDTITAALFNNEYNQIVNAFNNSTGHKHDGTTAEGPVIGLIGDAGETSPNNKVLIDTTNNYIEFYVEVSSAPVQQLYIADGAIVPVTDSDIDLGTTSLRFKDTYTDTVTTTGNVSIGGNLTVTGNATISGNLTFGDADTDSITLTADVASHITPDVDDIYDLGTSLKEWRNLYIDGTANIDSLVADTADINAGTIDNTVIGGTTAVAGTFTTATATTGNITTVNATTVDTTNIEVTNLKAKDGTSAGSIANTTGVVTLASSVLTTTDINGGTIDGVTIGGTTAGAVTFTDLSDGTITIAGFVDEDTMVSNSATLVPTQQSVKAYVDSQVTAQDLDFQGDSGGALSIDLDSETLTIAGGTGIDTVGALNTLTVSIDSTVATLTGTQTLTNKTLTSPVINTGVSGTAVLDDDTFATASATTLATSESIKAYVDAQILTEDTLAELNDTNITTPADGSLLFYDTLTSKWIDNVVSGDITIADTGVATIQPNSVALGTDTTGDYVGTITAGTGLTSTGATTGEGIAHSLSVDASQTQITAVGTLTTGTWNATSIADAYIDNNLTISGGTIDNSVIGGTTPAAADFTTMDTTGNASVGGNLTVTGDLTINGTTTTVNSTTVTIDDPIFTLGGDTAPSVDDNKDRGIEFKWHNGTAAKVGFFGYDDSASVFTFIPDATNTSEVFSGSAGNVAFGNIAGTLTTAAQTNITSVGTLSSLTVSGDATFDTSTLKVDSTNNRVGIGTTSPADELDISSVSPAIRLTDTTTAGLYHTIVSASDDLLISADAGNVGANTEIEFAIDGTERMRIDSSGNVGIGQTNPVQPLSISGASGSARMSLERSNTNTTGGVGSIQWNALDGHAVAGIVAYGDGNDEGAHIAFNTTSAASSSDVYASTTEHMRIDSSGNVIVGSTTANNVNAATLRQDGTAHVNNVQLANNAGSTGGTTPSIYSPAAATMAISTNSGERMRIDGSGNVMLGTTSPDSLFHIESTNTTAITIQAGTNKSASLRLKNDAHDWDINCQTTDTFAIYSQTDLATRFAILPTSGNVGIGTSSPNTGITVATSANISQVAITSSAGSVAWNATAAANAYYATTENTTFAAPTNAVEGAIISVEIAQGATAYTVAWNTIFEFAASTAPTVTATANKTDIFSFRYNGSVWQEIGRTQNLAQT